MYMCVGYFIEALLVFIAIILLFVHAYTNYRIEQAKDSISTLLCKTVFDFQVRRSLVHGLRAIRAFSIRAHRAERLRRASHVDRVQDC